MYEVINNQLLFQLEFPSSRWRYAWNKARASENSDALVSTFEAVFCAPPL